MSARKAPQQGMYRLRLAEDWTQECRVRWSARRTLALQVDARGVHVFAPHGLSLARLEAFVQARRDWLRTQLARRAEAPPAPPVPDENVAHGSTFSLLGKTARIVRDSPFRRPRWSEDADGAPVLLLPAAYTDEQARRARLRCIAERALTDFTARVAHYCARLQLAPPPVRLTRARSRWGSCSACSGIRLNLRLAHLAPHLIDYVVAHEVAHLREMNHSPRFWAIVASLYPDWQRARRELRRA